MIRPSSSVRGPRKRTSTTTIVTGTAKLPTTEAMNAKLFIAIHDASWQIVENPKMPVCARIFASGGASGSRMDREVQERPLSVFG